MSNNDVTALVREDLRAFAGYRSARSEAFDGRVWLNANESPWMSPADSAATVRRYPDPQPAALRERLASLYGCSPEQLLAGRGSDEAIDLLVRALCRPGQDAVVLTPPTFGMYAVCAKLHGARAVEVPLVDAEDGFACDFDSLAEVALASEAKLVFLCSPGNPSGTALPLASIAELARRLQGRALVVVDEAYAEYSDAGSAVTQIDAQPNIAVLRTMSKAHALAGARVGCVIADGALIEVLQRCQAPYPLPEPSVAIALRALSDDGLVQTSSHIATTRGERDRLCRQLRASPGVRRVYPSQANFLLVRFDDPQGAFDRLLAAGIVVRDMRAALGLNDALRISLGTPEQNAAVIDVLARSREAA